MLQWSIEEDPDAADLAFLADSVLQYGRSQAVGANPQPLACFLRDGQKIIAGAAGRIEFGRLFVGHLWVADDERGRGLGSETLARIEEAARRRGARDVLIETLNDRTAQLYRRLGYSTLAAIEHYVGDFTRHVMIKRMTQAPR
jgi:GNAT superfamily N-acetyltransferase